MSLSFAMLSLVLSLQEPSLPDVVVTAPRPDSVWCLRNRPRTGSRVRGNECRTYAEWVEVVAARQDQANYLFKEEGRFLQDSAFGEAIAEANIRHAARRRAEAQARAQSGG